MKRVLTRCALLIRCLHVRADDTVADGTFRLSFQCALDVTAKGQQAVHQAAVAEHDNALDGAEPGLPFLLRDGDTGAGGDESGGEGVVGGQSDAKGDWGGVGVDGDRGDDFGGTGVDFEGEGAFFGVVLGGEPVGDSGEGGGDDEWRDVLLRPGFERSFDAVLLLDPPGFGEAGEMEEGEVVEMSCKPLRFLFRRAFFIESECGNIVSRGVDGFSACYAEYTACEI